MTEILWDEDVAECEHHAEACEICLADVEDSPFNDTSRWTLLSARFETPDFLRQAMDDLMADFIASLPEDSPALALWNRLPKPPRS